MKRILRGLAALTFMLAAPQLALAETEAEREAREAAAEEAAEQALPPDKQPRSDYTGTLALDETGKNSTPGVVGTFTETTGKTYLVKLTVPKLIDELRRHNNKRVALIASVRNSGKYLIVQGVMHEAPPLPSKSRRPSF